MTRRASARSTSEIWFGNPRRVGNPNVKSLELWLFSLPSGWMESLSYSFKTNSLLFLLCCITLLTSCGRQTSSNLSSTDQLPPNFQTDYGQRVHEFGRPAQGNADYMPLSDTGFTACASISHYTDTKDTDPDYYTISITRQHGDSSIDYFEREFQASSLPVSVLTAKVKDIVSFDTARRIVTFSVGANKYSYPLPVAP